MPAKAISPEASLSHAELEDESDLHIDTERIPIYAGNNVQDVCIAGALQSPFPVTKNSTRIRC